MTEIKLAVQIQNINIQGLAVWVKNTYKGKPIPPGNPKGHLHYPLLKGVDWCSDHLVHSDLSQFLNPY